jgi:membrane protein DedA with SNARE-associated domain
MDRAGRGAGLHRRRDDRPERREAVALSDSLLDRLAGLPPIWLYLALALAAAIENFFPPFPADTVVALGSFLAARGSASIWGSFLATWVGNVSGAMAMYWVGRRLGAERVRARFARRGERAGEHRLEGLRGNHGVWALIVSRFLPGARALVPPFAGALHLPVWRTTAAIAFASAAWYGAITWLAYRVGADWDELSRRVASFGKGAGLVAAAIAAAAVVVWLMRRRRAA